MNILQEKLNNCHECPFEEYDINHFDEKLGTGKLGTYIYEGSDNSVMVVGQNPSHRRYPGTHSMNGKQGDIFREIFGVEHLVFSNFIQVSTIDNKVITLSDDEIRHCAKHLFDEIEYLKPKLIIFCGSFAHSKILELGLMDDLFILNNNIYFIKHPDYYLTYNKGNINEYYSQLESIKNQYVK